MLFLLIMNLKRIEQELLSIINFLFLIPTSVLAQTLISKNFIFLKLFLRDEDIFFKSQKNLTFPSLSINV